jgi:surface protein
VDSGTTWVDTGITAVQTTTTASVVQVTGQSTTDVMSQKAVTDALQDLTINDSEIYSRLNSLNYYIYRFNGTKNIYKEIVSSAVTSLFFKFNGKCTDNGSTQYVDLSSSLEGDKSGCTYKSNCWALIFQKNTLKTYMSLEDWKTSEKTIWEPILVEDTSDYLFPDILDQTKRILAVTYVKCSKSVTFTTLIAAQGYLNLYVNGTLIKQNYYYDFNQSITLNEGWNEIAMSLVWTNLKFGTKLLSLDGVTEMVGGYSPDKCIFRKSSCFSLPNLSQCTNLAGLFYFCTALFDINTKDWNTSAVTNMSSMFDGCSMITYLDLKSFNTSAVTNMGSMFCECCRLKQIDVEFDLTNVTTFSAMFDSCTSLTTINGTMNNIKVSFSVPNSPLTEASAMVIINGLADLTGETAQTLTLSSTTKALLTDADKLIATNKNWIIA